MVVIQKKEVNQLQLNFRGRTHSTNTFIVTKVIHIFTLIKDRRWKRDYIVPGIPAINLWIGEIWKRKASITG